MSLQVGARLGPYEIQAPVGAGGMGEVYRARDTRLDRTVAVKVLPDHVASDPDLKQRFEREAKTLAALSHPHICPVFDVGTQDGVDFIVMEYLEGQTLAERLPRAPGSQDPGLPLQEALRYAIEIADALDKAHRQGIVHRDLKPGNIMLTKSGAKLLDFGLAKTRSPKGLRYDPTAPRNGSAGSLDPAIVTAAPTVSTPLTAQGTLLGTFQYMAPEQLEGKEADARTDIFAFGAVVYEMVTGKKAFTGKSQASLIHAIIGVDPPPLSSAQSIAPPALDHVVQTCLEKDPDDRFHTAHDLLVQLKWIADAGSKAGVRAPVVSRRRTRDRVIAASVAALAAGILSAAGAWILKPEPARHITRFALTLPEGEQFSPGGRQLVALSPDGTHLVYVANLRLNLRAMDQLEATPIRSTEGGNFGRSPFFSPDGQWIGFWQEGQLRKVAVSGGAPVKLCDAQILFGGSWGADDTILFGQGPQGIWRVSGQGGTPEMLISVDAAKSEFAHGPQALPGADAILFTLATSAAWDDAQIVVQSLETGERKVLIQGGRDARYLPTGHLVYARQGTLLAVPFDVDGLEVTAGPVPLLEGVWDEGIASGAAHFSVSHDGSLVYVPGTARGGIERSLVWVDRQGREEPVPAPPRPYSWVRVSPDGTRLAMEVQDRANTDIWIYDLARRTSTRLTFGPESDRYPIWTPDSRRVAYTSGSDIAWKPADGTGEIERLATGLNAPRPFSWSGDGKKLIYDVGGPTGDIAVLSLDGERRPQPLIETEFGTMRPAMSPDDRWLAYQSNESGSFQIYIQPFPEVSGGRWQISTDGGQNPIFSPNGRELFYGTGNALMVVPIDTKTSFSPGTPQVLFQGTYFYGPGPGGRAYDIAPDGQRFLMLKNAGAAGTLSASIIVVENWLEELRARVPTN